MYLYFINKKDLYSIISSAFRNVSFKATFKVLNCNMFKYSRSQGLFQKLWLLKEDRTTVPGLPGNRKKNVNIKEALQLCILHQEQKLS